MIVERSLHPQFLSNTYLVAAGPGEPGAFVDAGGPVGPLLEAADRHRIEPTHVLLTHHHHDHVSSVGELLARWPELQVVIHPLERPQMPEATGALEPGSTLSVGELEVRALPTPGHTSGMLSLLVRGPGTETGEVFTGDTLFRHSVGGVRAPGHTTYEDLRRSIMEVLMRLAPETVIRPGHTDPSTVAEEWENNPFIRVWRSLDPEGAAPCTALGRPATLILLAPDYDGGHKAWVRWPDGSDDIVPGSSVGVGDGAGEGER
jgi:glyoxylase-like metal-dependent hydrolase (beta-lactamase superfamily II)